MPSNITAKNAKQISINWNRIVAEEIAILDVYIADALQDDAISTVVSFATTVVINNTSVTASRMTANSVEGMAYHNAWQNNIVDAAKSAEMASVIKHFTDLGYSIARESNGNLFSWKIAWS